MYLQEIRKSTPSDFTEKYRYVNIFESIPWIYY